MLVLQQANNLINRKRRFVAKNYYEDFKLLKPKRIIKRLFR